jgi:hypothetical protein
LKKKTSCQAYRPKKVERKTQVKDRRDMKKTKMKIKVVLAEIWKRMRASRRKMKKMVRRRKIMAVKKGKMKQA